MGTALHYKEGKRKDKGVERMVRVSQGGGERYEGKGGCLWLRPGVSSFWQDEGGEEFCRCKANTAIF